MMVVALNNIMRWNIGNLIVKNVFSITLSKTHCLLSWMY
jgi:hypothetical protein